MKTTLDLPGDLIREVKLKAVREGQKLKDAVAELLRIGLATNSSKSSKGAQRPRRKPPVIRCRHAAAPSAEMTPQRVADVLLQQEAQWHAKAR